ncbi:MAG: mannitol-1-phosphate 5-dehydrogenase [Alistipes sp.]|nr:mannitol-1-phosphate 5-dehydrogenase [Alistipes sp.]
MNMKALHFGAGKIGRGFIGALLRTSGYDVVFADALPQVVDTINHKGSYCVHLVGNQSVVQRIDGVSAVVASSDLAVEEVSQADVITTAVSMSRLADVAAVVARGLERRHFAGVTTPLNILCCENGIRATSHLRTLVAELIDLNVVGQNVGFVDCCVDRIVPIIAMENPLDVAVEPYFEWCIDRTAVVGELANLTDAHFVDDIDAYVSRKLFTLNTAHCTTAYLGAHKGYKYIHEAICDADIREIVSGVMRESGSALVKKFSLPMDEQMAYAETILLRFANARLGDTVSRVSRDPKRKLSPQLYFSYPISLALECGVAVDYLATAVAAALAFRSKEDAQSLELQQMIAELGVENTIREVCKITDSNVLALVAERYNGF